MRRNKKDREEPHCLILVLINPGGAPQLTEPFMESRSLGMELMEAAIMGKPL